MRSIDEISQLYKARRDRLSIVHQRATEIRNIVLGDIVLPLPELDSNEKSSVANLLLQGVEQKSMRIASIVPNIWYPPMSENTQIALQRARDRIAVNNRWWTKTRMQLVLQKRARQLSAYTGAPVLVRPDMKTGLPTWYARDFLTAYPPDMRIGEIQPEDCIFVYPRPYGWLRKRYQAQMAIVQKDKKNPSDDDLYSLIEYVDADEYVLGVLGKEQLAQPMLASVQRGQMVVELERAVNRIGMCPAVVPGRVSLDRPQSEFEGMIGMYQTASELMALELIGVRRSVFPEEWAVSNTPGVPPNILEQADPHLGVTGAIQDGTIVQFKPDPSVMTLNAIDRLEREQRVQASLPAEFGGESASNIRTGRRGAQIVSNAIDFGIQEAQNLLQESLQVENKIAIAIDKAYFNTKKTVWIGRSSVTYTPSELWETDESTVEYPSPGLDAAQLPVEVGQRIGTGTMSKRRGMELDPMIQDPDQEVERMEIEALRQALLGGIAQLVGSDPSQVEVVASMIDKITGDHDPIEVAWRKVHEELQAKQQAAQTEPMTPDMQQQLQPGAAQPQAAIQPGPPSLDNLHMMLRSLGQPA